MTLNYPKFKTLVMLFLFAVSYTTYSQTPDYKIQHLRDDIARGGGTNTTFTAVASLNNAVALANNNRKSHAGAPSSGGDAEGDDMAGARQLTGTSTLTYYREVVSNNIDMRFETSIWEYIGPIGGANEMIVRGRYAVSLNGGTNNVTQALAGITNASDCIPFITGILNNSINDDADSGTAIAYLENATTLRVQKGSNANNVTVYITVVEFTGSNWAVLHGDSGNVGGDSGPITLRDGSDGTGTATNVSAWSNAIIFSHHRGDNNANGVDDAIADNWPVMTPNATNQVDWTFHSNHVSAQSTNRHFVHVLDNSSLNVTRFQNTSSSAGESTVNITSAGLTDVNQALIVGSSTSSGTGTAYGRGWRNYYLNTTIQAAHWSHRSGNTMSHEIQIVDLSGLETTVSGPEINITGLGNTITDGDTTPNTADDTDFGSVDVGSGTNANTYTIENVGTSNLNLTGASPYVVIFGANAADFTLTANPTTPISASGNTTFSVSFTPSGNGLRTATISIANNDSNENPYTFDIQGTGQAGLPKYTAYYQNFDASNDGWSIITSTNDTWIRTNSFTTADEMGEGSFWRNSNYDSYSNNTDIVIESPQYNFTGIRNILFSIDIKYNTENNEDGMRILYSVSGGAYTLLGASGTGTNWYEDNVGALGSDGWNDDGHSATPSFTPHSQFGRSSLSLSDGIFSNQSNVRFRIEFASDGGSNREGVAFDNVLIEADPIVALNDASIAPANITSKLRLWLKANTGIAVSDGSALTNWEDQAYDTTLDKEDAYATTSLAPTYRDNATRNINFNPVADFDNNNTEYMNGKGGFFSQEYFVVMRSDDIVDPQTGSFSPGRQFGIGGRYSDNSFHEDPSGLGMGSTSARFSNEILSHNISSFPNGSSSPPNSTSWGRAYTTTTVTYQNHPLIVNVKTNAGGTSTEIYKNGKRIDNTNGKAGNGVDLNFNEFNNLQFLIGMGRSGIAGRTTSQLNGMIAEVISYSSPNSAINQQKIQSYLGIKYGVTMQDDTSSLTDYRLNDVDYIDSQGNVIWDTSVNAGYNYDIAGIGRDDDSLLNQKQSRSQNDESDGTGSTSGFLKIGLTELYDTNNDNITSNITVFNDKEFLVWGNNNANLGSAAATITVNMSAGPGITPALTTNVSFTAMQRIWKVVENGGDIPSVQVSIPQNAIRNITPPGSYLMFISDNGIFDPTAKYRVMTSDGNGNLLAEYDFDGTKYITFGYAPQIIVERSIYFDGAGDYVDMEDALDLNPSEFTVSAWIKRDAGLTNASIISKRDVSYTEGYDFKITSLGRFEMSWKNGSTQTIVSDVVIPENEWHHVAVIYNGSNANLYIDGVLDKVETLSAPTSTTQSFFIAAAGKNTPERFFKGNIDEVRVWDIALSVDQLRYIMNQEIVDKDITTGLTPLPLIKGYVIPITITKNEIAPISWASLAGYYPMSIYTYTNTNDLSGNNHQGALRNLNTVDRQTAPLPYESQNNGDLNNSTTWLNGNVQTIPGTTSIANPSVTVDWNIVRTSHNVDVNRNLKLLGLISESTALVTDENITDSELTIGDNGNDYELNITHYLKLDGKIDLQNESQLIQGEGSWLDFDSSGYLERDQQGTANSFTYNYWSSPVSLRNITANNTSHNLVDVLRDGHAGGDIVGNLTFGSGPIFADGPASNPRKIATYWLWKFVNNQTNDYANWEWIGDSNNINVTEGFTMKGISDSGSLDMSIENQNHVFRGKPNNVLNDQSQIVHTTFTASFDTNGNPKISLAGNPFPSALDADKFITDNLGSINGQLYFWEHWGGGTHKWAQYQGGYSIRTMATGVPAVSHPDVDQTGSGTKTPTQYIPVGQGFYVIQNHDGVGTNNPTNPQGGDVVFKNSQRIFITENLSTGNSVFTKGKNSKEKEVYKTTKEGKKIIRIGFTSPTGFHRQVATVFMDGATDEIDHGYDGVAGDFLKNDAFFAQDNRNLVINAFGEFDVEREISISVFIDEESEGGLQKFKVVAIENFDQNINVYIKDNQNNGETYEITNDTFEIQLEPGEHKDRFSLVFQSRLLAFDELPSIEDGFEIYMNNDQSEININRITDVEIVSATLFNYLGQTMKVWTKGLSERNIKLPVNTATGGYILNLKTTNGNVAKKLIIK